MNLKKIFFILVIIMLLLPVPVYLSGDNTIPFPRGNVVIFGIPQKNPPLSALTDESVDLIIKELNRHGRLRHVERNRLNWAINEVRKKESKKNFYKSVTETLGADLFILVNVFPRGKLTIAEMKLVPLKDDYKYLEKTVRLKSRIIQNIPLKLGREIAYLHKNIPVTARVIRKYKSGLYQINAGQWNGIKKGNKYRTSSGYVTIREMGRYESLVKLEGVEKKSGDILKIKLYPDTGKSISNLNRRISKNTEFRYGIANTILKGDNTENRIIEGICIVNMGGNICLPGYGAFLSTHYMGFKNPSPAISGIVISSSMVLLQLTLTSMATKFKANFFPWERDCDKTESMQNLHIFLWSTLPLTFSAAYMDQLAYQFSRKEVLPPFFRDRDSAAAVFSIFIPGGGLFYKGHRLAGWCYYFSEMMLAGYGVYYFDSGNKGIYALSALGAVKLLELVNAYFIKPSYRFYNIEMEREYRRVSLSVNTRRVCHIKNRLTEDINFVGVDYRL